MDRSSQILYALVVLVGTIFLFQPGLVALIKCYYSHDDWPISKLWNSLLCLQFYF